MPRKKRLEPKTTATPATADRPFMFAGIAAAVIGAALLVGVAFAYVQDVEREKTLLPAQGMVIEQVERSYGTEKRVVITVRFTTADGKVVRFQETYADDATRPSQGDAVTVVYPPGDPTRAEIQDVSRIGFALVGAVGAGFLLMGVAIMARTIAARRRLAHG